VYYAQVKNYMQLAIGNWQIATTNLTTDDADLAPSFGLTERPDAGKMVANLKRIECRIPSNPS
jgi:hypothetical protein